MRKNVALMGMVLILALVGVVGCGGNDEDTPAASGFDQYRTDMLELADKLESCAGCSQTFTHPFTQESLERRIEGLVDGKCLYIEEMPNGGRMECSYSPEQRKAVARYYRELMDQYSRELADKGETILEFDDDNPMNTYLNDGTCVVLGYDWSQTEYDLPTLTPIILPPMTLTPLPNAGLESVTIEAKAAIRGGGGVSGGRSYSNPIEVVLSFTGEAAARALRHGSLQITTAEHDRGDFELLGTIGSIWEFEVIDHAKVDFRTEEPKHPEDGFNVEMDFFPVEGATKITTLKGMITIQSIDLSQVITIVNLDSLLSTSKTRLEAPIMNYPAAEQRGINSEFCIYRGKPRGIYPAID